MKKRVLVGLALLTFVTAGAVFAPRAFAQSPTLDKLKFAVSGNDQTVTMANTSISGAVVIPDTYNNKPVNRIGVNGFRNCSAITSVTIPASVTSIASAAFNGCTNLTSVTFGGSNTSFNGSDAFPSNSGNELRDKYKAGGAGTYTRSAGGTVWTKQGTASAPAVNTSLDGWWIADSGLTIIISGNTGTFLYIGSSPVWQSAQNKNLIKGGDQKLRNIRSTGNLTWTMEELGVDYNPSTYVATGTKWGNTTLTMSADGQTLRENGSVRWTREVPHQ
jgi:hypothetical protein